MSRSNANKSLPVYNFANRMTKRILMTLCIVVVVFIIMARPLNASAVASSRRLSLPTSSEGGVQKRDSSKQTFPFHNNIPSASLVMLRLRPLALLRKNKQEGATTSSSSSSSLSSSVLSSPATAEARITVSSSTASASKLGALAAYFDACLIPQSDCGIDTQRFLEACRQLESFMVSVGHKQSAKDLLQNIKKIEGACARTPKEMRETMLELLQYEKSTGIHDGLSKSPSVRVLDEESGAMGLLWIKRSLAFQHTMYSLILDDPDMDGDLDEENINTINDKVAKQISMTSLQTDMSTKAALHRTPRRAIMSFTGTDSTALRTTQMVATRTMTKSNSSRFKCPAEAAQVAYSRVLEPHHGWALRKIYALALRSTTPPTRRDLLAELGGFQLSSSSSSSLSEKERQQLAIAENDLRLLVTSWEPLLDRCKETFKRVDLDDTRKI